MGLPHFMLVLNGFWFYLVARDRGHLHESGLGFGRDQESTVILNNVFLLLHVYICSGSFSLNLTGFGIK